MFIIFRQQTSLLALRSAKQKAIDMGQSLQASVGKVLNVTEEICEEWQGVNTDQPITTKKNDVENKTLHCKVKISAMFELKHVKKSI